MDILFFINLLMDCLLLLLVSKILKQTTTWIRILLAGIIGAGWVCIISVYPIRNTFVEFVLSNFVISIIMLRISFRLKGIYIYFKNVITLYIGTFLFGGIFNSIYYHTNIGYYFNQIIRGEYVQESNLIVFLLISAAAFFAAMKIIGITDKHKKIAQNLYRVKIEHLGKSIQTTALLDTGNGLKEPISGKPVCIIEQKLADSFKEVMDETNFKVIPFRSVGKEQGIMYGMTVRQLVIYKDQQPVCIRDAVLGFYEQEFSGQSGYHMILHPALLEQQE